MFTGPKSEGIPWFGILNATDGKPIAISEDKDVNVGIRTPGRL